MSQLCPNCSSSNLEGSRFCANCGATLLNTGQSDQPVPPTPPEDLDQSNVVPPVTSDFLQFSTPNSQADMPATPAYVVKTSPDLVDSSSQAPTIPMNSYGSVAPPPVPPTSIVGGQSQSTQHTGYQSYAPGASNHKEGGVYTSYSTESAAALERPKESRSWLMPVVVVAALVLLALVTVSVYLVINNRGVPGSASDISGQPSGGGSKDPASSGSEDEKIREVIRQSNQQQIQAWRDLDADLLKGTYTGEALAENVDMVTRLKKNKMYAIPVNQKLDILDVDVKGDEATAHTLEIWTVTFHNKSDDKVIDRHGPDTLKETYSLVKKEGKWMIRNLVIQTPAPTTPTVTGN